MRKRVIFFIGIVLLCTAAWGLFLFNKPHEDVGGINPDMSMQANKLYQQYNKNEAAANNQFLNKIISVTGIVNEINETKNASIILLKNKDETGGVSCNLFARAKVAVQQGETLTIKGRCTGFLMDVALTDCVIEKQ